MDKVDNANRLLTSPSGAAPLALRSPSLHGSSATLASMHQVAQLGELCQFLSQLLFHLGRNGLESGALDGRLEFFAHLLNHGHHGFDAH